MSTLPPVAARAQNASGAWVYADSVEHQFAFESLLMTGCDLSRLDDFLDDREGLGIWDHVDNRGHAVGAQARDELLEIRSEALYCYRTGDRQAARLHLRLLDAQARFVGYRWVTFEFVRIGQKLRSGNVAGLRDEDVQQLDGAIKRARALERNESQRKAREWMRETYQRKRVDYDSKADFVRDHIPQAVELFSCKAPSIDHAASDWLRGL